MIEQIQLNGRIYSAQDLSTFLETAKNPQESAFYQEIVDFLRDWFDEASTVWVQTSGSTGEPKPLEVAKAHMRNSAKLTCSYFGLRANDSALLCMSVKYIAGKMMLVRAITCQLSLWVVPPTSHPLKEFNQSLRFAAMVPMQIACSMQDTLERSRLEKVEFLLIGGGAIQQSVEEQLALFPHGVYASYGMTETVSHIAMRQLNGSARTQYYTPLDKVSLSQSPEGALVIWAPQVCSQKLTTNDVAEFDDQGRFKILGRLDNVINSGGVKLQAEKIEEKLQNLIPVPYVITSVSHLLLGQAVVLLIASKSHDISKLKNEMESRLTAYERPKHIFLVEQLPLTQTQKIRRSACKELATELYTKQLKQ